MAINKLKYNSATPVEFNSSVISGTNTGDQTITLTGDVTGSGTGSFATTLANSGVTAGTYTSVTVDAKGRVTAGTNPVLPGSLVNSNTSTQSGYFGDIFLFDDSTPSHYLGITNSANLTAARTLSINVNDADRTVSLSGNLTVSSAATISGTNTGDQTITLTGDVTGSGTGSFATTLANSGVTAGTYNNSATAVSPITVDAKGRITSVGTAVTVTPAFSSVTSKPTTLSGYGITDALSNSTTSTQSGYFGDIFLFDDSTPSHYLQVTNSANLTAARSLSINVNDANRIVSLSGDLTVSAAATVSGTNTGDQTITLTGNVTGSGTGSFATTIANSAVTFAKIQNSAAAGLSVIGRSANSAGVFAEISAANDGEVLRRSGTTLGFGILTLENLPDSWVKLTVKAATTADLAAASSTATTLTGTLVVFPAQDGITINLNDRILVKNQTTSAQNGIYTLTTVGVAGTTAWVLTRATDADTASELAGATVAVDQGTTQGGFTYDCDFKSTDTIGTTACNFARVLDTAAISGDATVSVSGALTIANNAVTFAKIQNSAAAGMSVVGRSANSAGVFAEISAGTDGHVLRRSGTAIGFGEIATAGIANDAVTFAKIQNSAAAGLSVIGRSANSAGDFAEIAAGTDGHVLYRASSTSLTFGQLPTASIANSAITYAKIQNVSATDRLLGRSTAGAGVIEEITCTASGRSLISLNATQGGVLYGSSTSAAAYSAAGSSGQFLKSNGTSAPTWTTLEMSDIPGAVYKKSVKAATTADLGTVTYANGTAGVGATITGPTGASAVVFPAQDGITIALNDRILVKNQTTSAQNGIYILTTVGVAATTAWVLTRATDADTNVEIGAAVVAVDQGTANGGELWTTNFKSTDTVGTTAMTWNEILFNNYAGPTFSGTLTTGGTITTGSASFDLINTTAATVNFAGAGTAITIGATTGTTTIRNAISPSNGIAFPATQVASTNANTLDDYEEGSWTPIYQGSTIAGAFTYAFQSARYIKIGKFVYVEGALGTNAVTTTPTGNISIGGLPFTSENTTNQYGSFTITYTFGWSNLSHNRLYGLIFNNTTAARLYKVTANATSQDVVLAGTDFGTLTANNYIYFTGVYRASA